MHIKQDMDKQKDSRNNLLQKVYDATPVGIITYSMLGNRADYKDRPVLPAELYQLAYAEAGRPMYDTYYRAGWTQELVANKLAKDIYANMMAYVHEGPWTEKTRLTKDEWDKIDYINETRYLKHMLGDEADATEWTASSLKKRNKVIDKFRKNYAAIKSRLQADAEKSLDERGGYN